MFFILCTLILGAGYTCLLEFTTSLSPWFLFAWVPAGLILGLITTALLILCYLALIGQHTSNNHYFKHMILRSAVWLALTFYRVKIEVVGMENLPKNTFVIYANHKSNMDPLILYRALNIRPITAVGKKSLFNNFVMKLIGKTFKAVVLDRDNDREAAKTMVGAIKQVKEGLNTIIFPEGGIKSRDVEEMVALRAGAYKLAQKPGADIWPVSIVGSSFISKEKRTKKKVVKIVFHKPFTKEDYAGMNTTEIGHMVEEVINNGVKQYE